MKTSAFTLLEIVIAMLIFSIVGVGTYALFVSNYKFLIEAKNRLQAVNQASKVLEKLRLYVSMSPVVPETRVGEALEYRSHRPEEVGLSANPTIEGVSSPQWSYLVEPVSVEGVPIDCRKVTVSVRWDEP